MRFPLVRVADFDEHKRADETAHEATTRAVAPITTILEEVRAINATVTDLSSKVKPLEDIVKDREFRARIVRFGKSLASGIGWIIAALGGIAAVAAWSPRFNDELTGLLGMVGVHVEARTPAAPPTPKLPAEVK